MPDPMEKTAPDPDPERRPDGPHHPGVKPRDYLPTLDGWRAVAVVLVLLCHIFIGLLDARTPIPKGWLYRLQYSGRLGVDIFFAISGFLICTRLLWERERAGRIDLGSFYWRRAWRILPPYYSYLAILSVVASLGLASVGAREWLGCLTFTRNYLAPREGDGWYTGHFWSLAVEEHFYLIWPWLLILLLRTGRPATWTVALAMAIAAWRFADPRDEIAFGLARRLGVWPLIESNYRTDTRIDGLLMGCWAAFLFADPDLRRRAERLLGPWAWRLLAAALAVTALATFDMGLRRVAIATLAPLVVLGTTLRPGSAAGRLLEWGPLTWIGRRSYSIYLWQQLFFSPRNIEAGPLWSIPLNLSFIIACSMISYQLIEKPAIGLGRRLSGRRRTRALIRDLGTPQPGRAGIDR